MNAQLKFDPTQPTTVEDCLAVFDTLEPVPHGWLRGVWRGAEVFCGHPMEGQMQNLAWYGKAFVDDDSVHPLLFSKRSGGVYAVHPGRIVDNLPLPDTPWLATLLRTLSLAVGTRSFTARLRQVEHRGVVSTAMVYDHRAIIDHFRKLDDDRLLGLMDRRGDTLPYFFTLTRDPNPPAIPGVP